MSDNGDTGAGLIGQTSPGRDIEGSDSISLRPKKGRGKLATGAEAASWGAIKQSVK